MTMRIYTYVYAYVSYGSSIWSERNKKNICFIICNVLSMYVYIMFGMFTQATRNIDSFIAIVMRFDRLGSLCVL